MEADDLRNEYRAEVEELTDFLRHNDKWVGLRRALASEALSPKDVLLATFFEDEEGHEYGVFVTSSRRIYEFKKNSKTGAEPRFLVWRERTGDERFERDCPQIREALALLAQS